MVTFLVSSTNGCYCGTCVLHTGILVVLSCNYDSYSFLFWTWKDCFSELGFACAHLQYSPGCDSPPLKGTPIMATNTSDRFYLATPNLSPLLKNRLIQGFIPVLVRIFFRVYYVLHGLASQLVCRFGFPFEFRGPCWCMVLQGLLPLLFILTLYVLPFRSNYCAILYSFFYFLVHRGSIPLLVHVSFLKS